MINKEIRMSRNKIIIVILFIFLYLIIYNQVYNCNLIWYDEGYQLALNNHTIQEIIYFTSKDLHVPLFAILSKIFNLFPIDKIQSTRILLTIIVIAHFVIAFYPLERLTNKKVAITYSILFLFSPAIIYFGLDIRMYALTELNLFCQTIYILLAIKYNKKKDWIKAEIFAILSCYSHLLATAIIFIFYLTMTIYYKNKNQKLSKKFFVYTLIIFISFIPWLKTLLKQIKIVTNVNRHRYFPKDLSELILLMISSLTINNAAFPNKSGSTLIMLILIVGIIIYIVYYKIAHKNNFSSNWYLKYIVYIFVISIIIILSYTYLNKTFYSRYFSIVYSIILLMMISYFANKPKIHKLSIIFLFFLCFTVNYKYININKILQDDGTLKKLNQDIINNNNNEEVYIYHVQEVSIGTMYMTYFKEYNNYIVLNNTYGYPVANDLTTLKVFGDNVYELRDIEEMKNYTSEFFLIIKEYDDNFEILEVLNEKKFDYLLINKYEYKYDNSVYYLYKITSI